MSGDYIISAKYGGIQDYHDAMNNIARNIADAQDGCRQTFNALEPCLIGELGNNAQTTHQCGMQAFGEGQTDWNSFQRQSIDQVAELAAADRASANALGGFC